MSSLKKVIMLDDTHNKCYTFFVPTDRYNKIHEDSNYASVLLDEYSKAGKVQVSDTQPVKSEKLNASSIEEQIPLPTRNTAPRIQQQTEDNSMHNWTNEETFLLIECYREEEVHLLVHKNDITAAFQRAHEKMSHILKKNKQQPIDYKKCVSKFDQLKRSYKKNIDKRKKSGNKATHWPFFDAMHEIFSKAAKVKRLLTAGNRIPEKPEDIASTSTSSKRPNIGALFLEEWSAECKRRREIDAVKHADKMERLDRLADSIGSIAETFKAYTAAIIKKVESQDSEKQ